VETFISLTLIIIFLAIFATPKAIEIALAQSNLQMENISPESSNNTGASTPGAQLMKLQAQLKPHDSQGLADSGWYQIKKFGFVASHNSDICPKNNCKYTVENGQFSPNTITGGYVFQGNLKVTAQEDDVKKSKFYKFFVTLDKIGEEEAKGKTSQSLGGTFGFGENMFSPDIMYYIYNATLQVDKKSPTLTIEGQR